MGNWLPNKERFLTLFLKDLLRMQFDKYEVPQFIIVKNSSELTSSTSFKRTWKSNLVFCVSASAVWVSHNWPNFLECWWHSQFCYQACLSVFMLFKTLSAQRAYRQSWERMVSYSRSSWQINRILCLASRRLSAPISWENYNRQSMLGHWLNRQSIRPCVPMSRRCRLLHHDSTAWFIHGWQSHGCSSRYQELCFSVAKWQL